MTNTLKNKFSRLVILASFFSLLTSCGQGLLLPKDLATLLGNKTLSSIAISSPSTKLTANGTPLQFTATGTYSDGSTQDITSFVTWSSSSGRVTFSTTTLGLASAGAGSEAGITITATEATSGLSGSLSGISVVVLNSITITAAGNATAVQVYDTLQFTATGIFSDGSTEDITSKATWSSSLPAIISVDATTGLVTGVFAKIAAPFPVIRAALAGVTSNAYSLSCTPPPGKRTFVTTAASNANLGGIAGADARCMADPQSAGGTYKAMIVDGVNRRACTSANCNTGGVTEHIDWVFQPNTYYYRINNSTWIGVTNTNGLLIIPLANTYRNPLGTLERIGQISTIL